MAQQVDLNIPPTRKNIEIPQYIQPDYTAQSRGVPIWSNDFSNPSDWTMTNTSNPALDWVIETDVNAAPRTEFRPVGMVSASNGYLLINSDAAGSTATQNADVTLTTAINMTTLGTTANDFGLVFDHCYRNYYDMRIVRVSGDGGANWTDFVITDGNSTSFNSANPETTTLNISSIVAPGGVLSTNVLIEFNYQGAYGWFWAVDDVRIVELDNHDLSLDQIMFGSDGVWGRLPYYQIPVDQIAPITFSGVVTNIGAADQTNTILDVFANAGAFTDVSPSGFTSVVGSTDTLTVQSTFTPNAVALPNHIDYQVYSDNADANPLDNSETLIFNVTDYIYARDNGTADGTNWNSGEAFEVGNAFDIFTSSTLYSIDVTTHGACGGAPIIYGALYQIDQSTGNFVLIEVTDDYYLDPSEFGSEITLPLLTPQTLTPFEGYIVVVGTYGDGGASNDLVVATAGTSDPQTSYFFDGTDQNWYYTTKTPMVRMNFEPTPIVSFISSSANVDENVGSVTVDLSITNSNNVPTTARVMLGTSSATNGSDFTFTDPTIVTFPANSSANQNIVIPITDDAIIESTETIYLIIDSVGNNNTAGVVGSIGTYAINIIDNDLIPTVSFNTSGVTVNENAGTVTVDIDIIDANNSPTSVDISLGTSTASNGADFVFTNPTTLTFPANNNISQSVTLTIVDDALVEGSEDIVLELTNVTNNAYLGTNITHTVIIADNDVSGTDPQVEFNASSVTVNESTGTVDVIVDIVNANSNATSVDVELSASSATNGSDFTFTNPTTVTFPANSSSSQIISIPIIDDILVEGSESINLSLTNPTNNATIGSVSTHLISITDNDVSANPLVAFGSSSQTVSEGVGSVTVNISISNPNSSPTDVDVALVSSTATNGSDFTFSSPTTVSFPANSSTSQSVTLPITDDLITEGTENIVLQLQNPSNSASIGTISTHTINITDNDVSSNPVVSFVSSGIVVDESAGTILVELEIIGGNSNATSVEVALGSSTAALGSDFTYTTPTTVTFPANSSTNQSIVVGITDDAILESSETIVLNLQNPTNNATLGTNGTYTIEITDNETPPAPEISFEFGTLNIDESAGTLIVNLSITNSNSSATTADVVLSSATATIGADFSYSTPTTVTFPANSSSNQSIVIGIVEDGIVESNETITLAVNNITNGGIAGANSTCVITIVENDFSSVTESIFNNLEIYPNPAEGQFYIKGIKNDQTTIAYEVYDVLGKLQTAGVTSNNSLINIENLNTGSYFVVLKNEHQVATKKLIKN